MFDYLSITTFNRCCVECAGVRGAWQHVLHLFFNFSLLYKIEDSRRRCPLLRYMYPESCTRSRSPPLVPLVTVNRNC
jgi:hypothetical protein